MSDDSTTDEEIQDKLRAEAMAWNLLMSDWDRMRLLRKVGPPDLEALLTELAGAVEQLLAWQPICSEGSSGDLRQKRVRAALDSCAAYKEHKG